MTGLLWSYSQRNCKGLSIIKYIRFFRVFDWIHLIGITILGYMYASGLAIFSTQFWMSLLISALYLAHGYSLNQCYDHRLANKVQLKGNGHIPFRRAISLTYLVFMVNIFFAYRCSLSTLILVIFGGLIGFVYSAPPLRLKGVPYWGFVCNSLCFVPLFLIGYVSAKKLDLSSFLLAVFVFLLFLPLDLIHQLNDLTEDGEQSCRTTAAACGIKKTLNLITVTFIILNVWTLIIWVYKKIHCSFFLLTLFFSVIVLLYLYQKSVQDYIDIGRHKIKMRVRYFSILYGLGIAVSFCFTKP